MKRQSILLSQQLKNLGIHSSVNSVDDLIECWDQLTSEQRVEGYRLLSAAEERVEVAGYSIRQYRSARDRKSVSWLRNYILNVVPDCSIFNGIGDGDSTLCNVAECEERVVGYVSHDEDSCFRYVHEIVVASKYRRRGVMSGLLSSIEGDVPLGLLVHSTNQRAQQAFAHFGFVQRSSTPDGYLFLVKEF